MRKLSDTAHTVTVLVLRYIIITSVNKQNKLQSRDKTLGRTVSEPWAFENNAGEVIIPQS